MSGFGQAQFGAAPYGMAAVPTSIWGWEPIDGIAVRRLDTVEFMVTNEAWVLADTLVQIVTSEGALEVVWNSAGFTERYRRGSARLPIAHGYHYVLRRHGGWKGAVLKIDVRVTDLAGEMVSGQSS